MRRFLRSASTFLTNLCGALLKAVVTSMAVGLVVVSVMKYMGVPVPSATDLMEGSRDYNVSPEEKMSLDQRKATKRWSNPRFQQELKAAIELAKVGHPTGFCTIPSTERHGS